MSTYCQDVADRLERAADRMANAGFPDEEYRYRRAAASIRAGLSLEQTEELERSLLVDPKPVKLHRVVALAAQGEYDGTGETGDQTGSDAPDQTADNSGIEESGASQLLSTAFSPGLANPFDPNQAGWSAASQDFDPYSASAGGAAVNSFTAFQSGDPFTLEQADNTNANPYTTGQNVAPATGSQDTESFTGGGAPTQSPSLLDPNWAAFGYAGPPPSILADPNLLAQNDAVAANPNVASDASPNYAAVAPSSVTINGINYVVTVDGNGDVRLDPGSTVENLPTIVNFSTPLDTSQAEMTAADREAAQAYYDSLDQPKQTTQTPVNTPPSTAQLPPLPAPTPPPDQPASPAPDPSSDQPATPQASPQAAPSSSPPPSPPPDPQSPAGPGQTPQMGSGQPGPSQEQIDEENWGTAKSGMWDALVDMVDATNPMSNALHSVGLPGYLDWAKSGPPAPTGNSVRDAELRDNYQRGSLVTMIAAVATPIGAEGLLASAETAAGKLPALEGIGMGGGGRLIGPTEQWLSMFGEEAPSLVPELETATPNIANSVPTGPSFEGVIDPAEFGNDPVIADRLSRARAFDIGEYQSLTGRGPYGRVGDMLDSDEALQNAFIRDRLGGERVSDFTRGNPAMALPPELHQTIRNLRVPAMQGMTPEQMLEFHLDQLEQVAPDYAVRTLERESLRFIDEIF